MDKSPCIRKMDTAPVLRGEKTAIPEITLETGAVVRILAGSLNQIQGPVRGSGTDVSIWEVALTPEGTLSCSMPSGRTAIAYLLEGRYHIESNKSTYLYDLQGGSDLRREDRSLWGAHHTILFDDGEEVTLRAGEEGMRGLLLGGTPLDEPVAWGGTVVMNTEDELQTAIEEVRNGTFIR